MHMTRLHHWRNIRRLQESQPDDAAHNQHPLHAHFRRCADSGPPVGALPSASQPNVDRLRILARVQACVNDDIARDGFSGARTMSPFFHGGESLICDMLNTAQYHAHQTLQSSTSDSQMTQNLDALINDIEAGSIAV